MSLNWCPPGTVRIIAAVLITLLPGPALPAGEERASQIVYRSMVESPRVATPGKMVDFLDERWVEDTHCLTRRLNQAELLPEPVLKHDNINCPLAASGTVLARDDGTFAFYYQTVPRFKPWDGLPKDAPESVKKKRWSSLYKHFLHYADQEGTVRGLCDGGRLPVRAPNRTNQDPALLAGSRHVDDAAVSLGM